jgi:hypothetical protein
MRKTALPLAAVALLLCPSLRGDEPAFEAAGAVQASRYLPADQLSGPEWKVEPEAVNDGLTNTFTLTSRFGSWPARGRLQVAVRIREIRALAQLETVSKSDVFKEAVKKSATAPLELAANVATKPVETLKGVPAGVGRWVKKTNFQVKETYHDTKEATSKEKKEGEGKDGEQTEKMKQQASSYALDQLKISGAERRWYKELGVDPYTDNETLRKAVKSVARVEGLTSFGMKFSGLPSIPGAREMRKTLDLVWNTDPWELRLRNRNLLLGAGLSEETVRAFEDNPSLSLSAQTAFLGILGGLKGVNGREHLLARAIAVESREEAQELVASASLLLRLHQSESPLREILPGPRLPVARTAKGGIVAVLMADAIFWTEEVAGAVQSLAELYAGETAASQRLYVAGEASSRVKSGAGKLGWEIVDRWRPKGGESAASR